MCLVFTLLFFSMNIIQIINTIKVTGPPFFHFRTKQKTCIQQEASKIHGVSKKTSFSQNCPWQILLLIMRNPLSFFMTNAGDSFCNSYIYNLVGWHIWDILGKRIQHRGWKTTKIFGTNLSHVLTHLFVVREGFGALCFMWVSHCEQ